MKAVLVIDMPMSCEECVCADICTDHVYCQANNYNIGNTRKRPSWCPLKPMPEWKETKGKKKWQTDYQYAMERHENMGWNEFRDKIDPSGWNALLEGIEQ